MGLPLIAADNVGCRDVVLEEINGFLCEPESVNSLAKCMCKFLDLTSNQRREMGLKSRLHVEKNFDEKIVIDQYLEKINIILNS